MPRPLRQTVRLDILSITLPTTDCCCNDARVEVFMYPVQQHGQQFMSILMLITHKSRSEFFQRLLERRGSDESLGPFPHSSEERGEFASHSGFGSEMLLECIRDKVLLQHRR